jgi:hypothetical protein
MDWRRRLDLETPLALKDKFFLAGLALAMAGFVLAALRIFLEFRITPVGIIFSGFPILLILGTGLFVLASRCIRDLSLRWSRD